MYKNQVLKALNLGSDTDTLNLTDDKPELLFGPEVEGKYQEGVVPPFYVSLNIHECYTAICQHPCNSPSCTLEGLFRDL